MLITSGTPALAADVSRAYRSTLESHKSLHPSVRVKVEPYAGANWRVKRMMELLESRAAQSLVGAYLHGSLATGEEIFYSDFDALAIVNHEVMQDSARLTDLARTLRQAEQIMFEFDPLQHHGWFVLSEADLTSYPESYFPHELFAFSKSLFRAHGLELLLQGGEVGNELRTSFASLASGLQRAIESGNIFRNMYYLKNGLSQFMLLPALYVQLRDGRAVFKKFSFEAARSDFTAEEWAPMERVSEIRKRWHYDISATRRWLLSRAWTGRRHLVRRLAPAVTKELRASLSSDLLRGMARLTNRMTSRLAL